jgi:hypothetical protein
VKRISSSVLSIVLSIALFLALAAVPLFSAEAGKKGSQGTATGNGILIPHEVFVGDTAELSFTTGAFNAAIASGEEVTVPRDDVAVSSDATVNSISVRRDESSSTVIVRFVPWTTGLLRLPPFTLKKIRVQPPPVRISSLAEKTGTTTLERARSPLLVPGTTLVLYALSAAAAVAVALAAIAAARLRSYLALNEGRFRSSRRTKFVMRELKYLDKRIHKIPEAEWYALFAVTLRRYFGTLLAGNPSSLLSSTSREIAHELAILLSGQAGSAECDSAISRAERLLTSIDLIRFSGRNKGDSREADLAESRSVVFAVEETIGAALDAKGDGDVQL